MLLILTTALADLDLALLTARTPVGVLTTVSSDLGYSGQGNDTRRGRHPGARDSREGEAHRRADATRVSMMTVTRRMLVTQGGV